MFLEPPTGSQNQLSLEAAGEIMCREKQGTWNQIHLGFNASSTPECLCHFWESYLISEPQFLY